ncbi:hypothetical protein M8013_12945 [Enterobacteriaceae bacterium H4N4]|uniref:Flavoprotein domain-containing protein n=1 Tax=Silvania confinis TaxID=2926470 RepID=A0A9J6QFX1_9ENTR|nr:flavoprotein [Silvania confinis]MCU6669652.1 hypothetical protein [Silvania confinis]
MADSRENRRLHELAALIDRAIAELLAQSVVPKNVRVVVTGDDLASLPDTLNCLTALEQAGYSLWVSFSHSASQSALKDACIDTLRQWGSHAGFDRHYGDYDALYLPALSINSMSKIALGIRDNLACEAVFQALQQHKPTIATLHPQCHDSRLPLPLLARLEGYTQMLESYGVTLTGKKMAHVGSLPVSPSAPFTRQPFADKKRLIALRDIRLLAPGEELRVERDTLITPAAKDEIKRRNLTVIYG